MQSFKLLLLAFIVPTIAIGTCYNPGPSFPPVDHILTRVHFNILSLKLHSLVDEILSSPDGWTTNTTSFAIQLTSSDETIWSRYYTAPKLGNYTDSKPTPVTGDTNFRVASISKTFTVYAILLEKRIGLEDPITKYLPELLKGEKPVRPLGLLVQWDQITIRALASQLSGISRETGLQDLAIEASNLLNNPIAHGFPPIEEEWETPCHKNWSDSCNATTIVTNARKRFRVFEPNDRSTYSNVAFSLLGLVLERVTGKSYTEVITESILDPLNMKDTRTSKPKDSAGIIPYGRNDWGQPLGADIPSGGIYCTVNDFSKYLRSILTPSLLPGATINAWMKPHSWTSSGTNSAYGMPWEILRTTKGTPDGRPIDIITKGGSLTGYFSTIALLPEFGLGITILVAGDSAALADLRERLLATIISATDKLIRAEVQDKYAGLWAYWDEWWGPPNLKWSLRLEVDDTGPGLKITNWLANGTDFLSVYGKLKQMPSNPSQWSARLLPTGVHSERIVDDLDTYEYMEMWRVTAVPIRREVDEGKIFDDYCMTDVDALMYAGHPVEEFKIIKGEDRAGPSGVEAFLMQGSAWPNILMFRVKDNDGRDLVYDEKTMKATRYRPEDLALGRTELSSEKQTPIIG